MIVLVGAMEEEIKEILNLVDEVKGSEKIGHNTFYKCFHNGKEIIVFSSGIGKSNAAASMMNLINNFKVTSVINLGLCGSSNANINSGDIVMSKESTYLDVDATAFGYDYGQVPQEDATFLHTNMFQNKFLEKKSVFKKHMVSVGTADTFISSRILFEQFPAVKDRNIDVIDMETNSFAQILKKYSIPFVAIRAVSDSIYESESSSEQFTNNLIKYAKRCKQEVLRII